MNHLTKPGRILFAIAIASFGIHYLVFAAKISAAPPGPPWFPGAHWLSWAAGAGLLIAGLSLLINLKGRWAALLLGLALLLHAAFVHLPALLANVHDPRPWTNIGEILSICGGALVLAGALGKGPDGPRLPASFSNGTILVGQYLFALPLFIFGAQHLIYGKFVATLIPSWIPGHLVWAYFIGAVFIATGLAIVSRQLAGLAATLLGLMFFLWVFILHSPLVAASPHRGNGWTSLFVALAMCGASWTVAGTLAQRE
jgi:uncharacterized membrane protein YphA (DoxX/SURF4 family)